MVTSESPNIDLLIFSNCSHLFVFLTQISHLIHNASVLLEIVCNEQHKDFAAQAY